MFFSVDAFVHFSIPGQFPGVASVLGVNSAWRMLSLDVPRKKIIMQSEPQKKLVIVEWVLSGILGFVPAEKHCLLLVIKSQKKKDMCFRWHWASGKTNTKRYWNNTFRSRTVMPGLPQSEITIFSPSPCHLTSLVLITQSFLILEPLHFLSKSSKRPPSMPRLMNLWIHPQTGSSRSEAFWAMTSPHRPKGRKKKQTFDDLIPWKGTNGTSLWKKSGLNWLGPKRSCKSWGNSKNWLANRIITWIIRQIYAPRIWRPLETFISPKPMSWCF